MSKKVLLIVAIILILIIVISITVFNNRKNKDTIVEKFVEVNKNFYLGNNYIFTINNNNSSTEFYYKDDITLIKYSNNDNYIWSDEKEQYLIIPSQNIYYEQDLVISSSENKNLIPSIGEVKNINTDVNYWKTNIKNIKKETIDNMKYYCLILDEGKIWIDSNNYQVIKYKDGEDLYEISYKLNVLTDIDVKKPDLENYTKQ